MALPQPVLVLVGVTGDLSKRKLLPALAALRSEGRLPFARIVGTSRRAVAPESLVAAGDPLAPVFEIAELPPEDPRAYEALAARLASLGGEAYFYLAVPPGSAGAIAARIAGAGSTGTLVLEKPFGLDGASARMDIERINASFARVVRVDHYLSKPLAERLAAAAPARTAARVDVRAYEALGLEGRAEFYDATGALRDAGNHLLSLLCAALGARTAAERAAQLRELSVVAARRAQYDGYAAEVGHDTDTETYVSLTLAHRQYPGVPITLRSGKALGTKQNAVRTDTAEFAESPDDEDAHRRLFAALVGDHHDLFLSEEEALESWRLLDRARTLWGSIGHYPKGAPPAL